MVATDEDDDDDDDYVKVDDPNEQFNAFYPNKCTKMFAYFK